MEIARDTRANLIGKVIGKRVVIIVVLSTLLLGACGESSGPAVAVSLNLYSIDGKVVPVQLRTPGGQLVTLADGRLQGTSWGSACGAALRLAEGPVTALEIASCRLEPAEERKFTLTLADSRFPAGAHEYRFVP